MLESHFSSSQTAGARLSKQLAYISNSSAKEHTSPPISISQGNKQTRAFG